MILDYFSILFSGGIYNSPVAEDCLSLLLILLENNQSNVTFFCETALIPKLIDFIVQLDTDANNWPEGKGRFSSLNLLSFKHD